MEISVKQANVKNWFCLHEAVWDHPFEKQPGISADKQKLLMLALVKFADGYGGNCHPGQTRLAAMTGQSASSVKRCLKLFKEKEFVSSDRRWGTSNAYTISEDNIREATATVYLSVLFFLARNDGLTPQVMGRVERTLGPFDAPDEATHDVQSGHGYDLLTTSLNLPKVELPVIDLSISKTNAFAIASHRAKSDQELIAEQLTKNVDYVNQEDAAAFAAGEAEEDTDLRIAAELYNQFFEQADPVAYSLAENGAPVDRIFEELLSLRSAGDERLREEISDRQLKTFAEWLVKSRGPKLVKPLEIAA